MTTEGGAAPIGASLAQFLENNSEQQQQHNDRAHNNDRTSNETNHGNKMPTPMDVDEANAFVISPNASRQVSVVAHAQPTVLHPSLLLDAYRQQQGDNDAMAANRCRILLRGPANSGKTSLALNLAYSMAGSASPCLCLDARKCRCTAVTIYKVALPSPSGGGNVVEDDKEFPLFCRPVENENEATVESSGEIQNEQPDANPMEDTTTRSLDWDPQILKRIRVHRVTSVKELLQDLLCLLGKPLQEQPRPGGAIVIDDIDRLVARDAALRNGNYPHGNSQRAAASAAILQIVAIATDTAMALESSHSGSSSHDGGIAVLVTTGDMHTVVSPCFDTIVTLQPSEQLPGQLRSNPDGSSNNVSKLQRWKTTDDGEEVSIESVWNVEASPSPWNEAPNARHTTSLEYAVMKVDEHGEKEIQWTRPQNTAQKDV